MEWPLSINIFSSGSDPNFRHASSYDTPLHLAVSNVREDMYPDFADIVGEFVKAGAKLNLSSQMEGDTPLFRWDLVTYSQIKSFWKYQKQYCCWLIILNNI